jgi:hypothetical protein
MNVSDIWQLGAQIIHAQSTHADGLSTDASLTSLRCRMGGLAYAAPAAGAAAGFNRICNPSPMPGKHFRSAAFLLLGYDMVTKISQNKRLRQRLTPSIRNLLGDHYEDLGDQYEDDRAGAFSHRAGDSIPRRAEDQGRERRRRICGEEMP